jgi:hypothetical protein
MAELTCRLRSFCLLRVKLSVEGAGLLVVIATFSNAVVPGGQTPNTNEWITTNARDGSDKKQNEITEVV